MIANININMDKYNAYCGNCGKYGHIYKKCTEPITSYGIILFKLDKPTKYENIILKNVIDKLHKSTIVENYNELQYNNVNKILMCAFKERINFLMIRRKHTLGYIEFIRGRYKIENVDGICFLFQQMTDSEINKIKNNNFDFLWKDFWNDSKNNSYYQQEFELSKKRFNTLKYGVDDDRFLALNFYIQHATPTWKTAEWGFPKGRRNPQETNIQCAQREFAEETGLDKSSYKLINSLIPLTEELVGTNGINYKHVYYIAMSNNDKSDNLKITKLLSSEIGDIGWFSHHEALQLIRPHHTQRGKVLTKLYIFIIKKISDILSNG